MAKIHHIALLRCIAATGLATLCPGILTGQSAAQAALPSPHLRAGALVRVWSPELRDRQGREFVLAAWDSDSLALLPEARRRRSGTRAVPAPGASPHRVSQESVARLDVLAPRSRGAGARVGGLSGAVIGALTGAVLEGLLNEFFLTEESWAFSIGVGAGVGGAMGMLGGALRPGARWQRVPLRHDIIVHPARPSQQSRGARPAPPHP